MPFSRLKKSYSYTCKKCGHIHHNRGRPNYRTFIECEQCGYEFPMLFSFEYIKGGRMDPESENWKGVPGAGEGELGFGGAPVEIRDIEAESRDDIVVMLVGRTLDEVNDYLDEPLGMGDQLTILRDIRDELAG